MDKFEKIMKQAVEGHEMPFNPQAWENVSNELGDSFDQMMKESTSGYEAPYNPAAWEAVSGQIGAANSAWKWIAGTAAAVAVVVSSVYIYNSDSSDTTLNDKNLSTEVAINDGNSLADNNSNTTVGQNENINNDENHDNGFIVENENQHDENSEENGNNVVDNGDTNNDNNENNNENGGSVVINPQNNVVNNNGNGNNNLVQNPEIIEYHADASFNASVSSICVKEKCIFTPEVMNSDLIYIWNFGDGGISASMLGSHVYKKAGDYSVTLEIKHPKSNKTLASSKETISINALPETNFGWEQSNEIIPTVNFINLTDEAVKWAWNIKGLKQSQRNEFEYTFRKAGKYMVELTAENDNGCKKSTQKTITIEKDYNLLAPTAFSPNGDFKNETFIPEALKLMDVPFTMNIMNKSGDLVYTTQSANEPWDGRITKDNTLAPAGAAYIWRVVLTNSNGEPELYEGQVIIIR